MNVPVFVINLDRDTTRMAQMAERLAEHGLPYERVPAVLGRALTPAERAALYDEDTNHRRHHTPLVDGEIGCYASHLRLWERLVREAVPVALVLEDDVLLRPTLRAVIDALAPCATDWDMVKLMGRPREPDVGTQPLAGEVRLIRYHRPPSLTGAYLISLAGARKLAARRRPFFRPIDVDLRHWWECDLRLFGVFPYPAKEAPAADQSSIAGRRSAARGLRWRLRKWRVQTGYVWQSWRAARRPPTPWPATVRDGAR